VTLCWFSSWTSSSRFPGWCPHTHTLYSLCLDMFLHFFCGYGTMTFPFIAPRFIYHTHIYTFTSITHPFTCNRFRITLPALWVFRWFPSRTAFSGCRSGPLVSHLVYPLPLFSPFWCGRPHPQFLVNTMPPMPAAPPRLPVVNPSSHSVPSPPFRTRH